MTTKPPVVPLLPANRVRALRADGIAPSKTDLERLIGQSDLLDLNYFWRGLIAARSVARIVLRDAAEGRIAGYATGFLVSPSLMLTNHHVFETAEQARYSFAEFADERGLMGEAPSPVRFAFAPDNYFDNDADLDIALVAVAPMSMDGGTPLADFGWLRLNPIPGKELLNEYVSIIQHPNAEPTQIAVRENQVVEMLPNFLRYRTDTQPGSSGSPVFNDSWQVVALHHSAVPDTRGGDTVFANEGVRISALLAHLEARGRDHPLLRELLALSGQDKPWTLDLLRKQLDTPTARAIVNPGDRKSAMAIAAATPDATTSDGSAGAPERLAFDMEYANRRGYDPAFLGVRVDLPAFTEDARGELVELADRGVWLRYHHFSVATHGARRLPHVVASNVDYGPSRRLELGRKDFGTDQWIPDPRLPDKYQTLAADHVYDDPDLDYGHVNRREDNCWGVDERDVIAANADTFHLTNCTPQHKAFNRSNLKGLWGELENQITQQARGAVPRLTLFAGPVLADSDGPYGRVPADYKVPRQFWKVVVAPTDDGKGVRAYGFLLDQSAAFDAKSTHEAFDPGAFKAYLVPLAHIEGLTGLRFADNLRDADVHPGTGAIELLGNDLAEKLTAPAPAQADPRGSGGRAFGRFPSLSAFLADYRDTSARAFERLTLPDQLMELKRSRDVVEVNARVLQREDDDTDPAGGTHYRLRLQITSILHTDPDVDTDLRRAQTTGADVFCAIRYGDAMGIRARVEGLNDGAELHLKGEWITRDKARDHGGERMSVLHFTHHPLGFTCTPVKCYS